jgi:hypothetical protein
VPYSDSFRPSRLTAIWDDEAPAFYSVLYNRTGHARVAATVNIGQGPRLLIVTF